MSDRFRLVFAGDVLEGHRVEDVQRQMTKLLRLTEAREQSMFSGKRTVLKRSLSMEDATRYVARFERIGARVLIEALPDDAVESRSGAESSRAPLSRSGAESSRAPFDESGHRPRRRFKLPRGRRPWHLATAIAAVVVLAALGFWQWGRGGAPLPPISEAQLAEYTLSPAARDAFLNDYWPGGGNKAFAASTGGAWGFVIAAASDQDAAQRALVDCEGRRTPDMPACRLVNLTGNWAPAELPPPEFR